MEHRVHDPVSPRLDRIAQLARRRPKMALTTLAHHIDVDLLNEAYRRTRKDAAAGVDGQTAKVFEANLQTNLQRLLNGLKSGSYKAPPLRRVHIPKPDGTSRPLGIPTLADKVLQRAVQMVLEAVYEQDFLDFSYGFRPHRSAHDALKALRDKVMRMGRGCWVVKVDIERLFDTLDHHHLRTFLDQRVRDGVIRRMIDKWLKAGVVDQGQLIRSVQGSAQGSVISPILANIYLHEVLDQWFEFVVKPRLGDNSFMIRYADDVVICFTSVDDACRVLDVLPKRLERYGLSLNKQKTKMLHFKPPQDGGGRGAAESFDLLGFTHYWAISRRGYWVVKRKTSKRTFARATKETAQWCRQNRHLPIGVQHRMLSLKLNGHYAYFGVTGNSKAIGAFYYQVQRSWHKWLNRRSQSGVMSWERFRRRVLARYALPPPRMVRST